MRTDDRLYEDQRTMSALMLDTSTLSRTTLMNHVEASLVREVVEAAARDGVLLDVPVVTWTCRVVGRVKGEGTVVRSQITGL